MALLLAFILVPLIEIALFIQVGDVIGLGWTLVTVVVTAIIGASLVRRQGADIMMRVQRSLDTFRDPTQPLAEGAMVLFSGALLLTPGFFTDFIGFALLVPGVRKFIIAQVGNRMEAKMREGNVHASYTYAEFTEDPRPSRSDADVTIEGDYEVQHEDTSGAKGNSGWTRH